MSLPPLSLHTETRHNPIDLIENLVSSHGWPFDRSGDDEVNICVAGKWCDYHLSFNWQRDVKALAAAAAFDFKAPPERREAIYELLCLINERLWVGHFDVSSADGSILFRHGLLLARHAESNLDQCETMLKLSVETAERYYPAFQFVLWAGKTAREAMEASLFECAGEA